ncbi:beta-ketoacyl synthase N-terminal-like domain-containing protein [Streptomyces albireticuli]|uniref:beta-ketoacyl synthase N-terminal-like domain-containing protein n=1 Tax=Streptomyces albireticuli TaxID=1940 RepID=UPI003683F52C
MDRAAQFAVACTRDALADSGLSPEAVPPRRIAVALGTAVASTTSREDEYLVMSDGGKDRLVDPGHISPYMFDYLSPGAMPAEVAWAVGAEGRARRRSRRSDRAWP